MSGQAGWQDAGRVAEMLAVEPAWLGGVVLRGRAGQVRDAWLQRLRSLLGPELPWCKLPHHVSDERLLGGLDLTATLREGRPVAERGVLAQADGGVVVVAMSERIATGAAARIGITMDRGEVAFERDGLAGRAAARFGAVLLDEGIDDECVPAALAERCAFRLDLDAVTRRDLAAAAKESLAGARRRILLARERWPRVRIGAATRRALCATALAFGVDSLRASLFAVRAACVAAALDGRREVEQDHATLAARLVIAPRATRLPPTPEEAPPEEATTPPPQTDAADAPQADSCEIDRELDDRVLEATHSALPPGLLALLRGGPPLRGAVRQNSSRAGTGLRSRQRGRPLGSRAGSLRAGGRLHLVDTLRAAAPWQPLRRRERPDHSRIDVRPDDLRIRQFRQRTQTTLIFVVDASGSSALHRLGEAKGAVELMLADCYARRDQVALIAFRGKGAELLLPPTRSLSRARRSLAGLPGGGGTPLAAGVDAATSLVEAARHRGETPLLVMLTDGRANIARDGTPGRPAAERDALAAARALRAREVATLLIDSAPAPQPAAQRLAEEMRARYLALPHADARLLRQAVRTGLVGAE
jgi:magnesium chelatase subunit D